MRVKDKMRNCATEWNTKVVLIVEEVEGEVGKGRHRRRDERVRRVVRAVW